VLILGVQLLIAILDGSADASCGAPVGAATQPRPSKDADAIPSNYLAIYRATGPHYGIPWTVLAGIGKVETDHGTSTLPGVRSGENFAGAGGPMQFLKATWDAYGVDGDHDNKKDRYNPADAIPGAANYLKHNGADRGGQKLRRAIWHYNHSWDYVDLVLRWAQRYADGHFTVGDHNTPEASCAAGFGQGGNWPPGSACPGGGALGAGHITARMRCVRDQIKAMFTIPHGIGCYRPNGGIPGGGEHPVGRACDFMISSGQPTAQEAQLGYDIANWVKSNAKRLGIYYIIYRQHIWNPARAREGWRLMEDRGSVTANLYDHVHVSVDG
jgi:hypothetical protein